MKTLIAEDDFTSRLLLQELLKSYGPCHIAVNGSEAVEAVRTALQAGEPYNLICLDIMMPDMDGQTALREIREHEARADIGGLDRVKIIMITALDDKGSILGAFREQCDAYIVKPIDRLKLIGNLQQLGLVH